MKSPLRTRILCCLAALIGISASTAAPVITSVAETGGDGTVLAQWTGNSFTGISPLGAYTVPPFSVLAKAYVDRTHAYTNASGTVAIPSYLLGNPYIMTRNDNRDNANFRLNVTVSQDVMVYLLIDNRIGDTTATSGNPPFNGTVVTSWSGMQWVGTSGFRPVTTAQNRTANATLPDELGIDEGADGGINNWFSIYSNQYPAGTFTLSQQGLSGNNMYGVVIVGVGPTAPPNAVTNVVAIGGDTQVTVSWSASSSASGYNVKRSSTSGGPYTTITSVAGTSYVDSGLANGVDYFYVVSGTNILGEGSNSAEVVGRPNPVVVGITAAGGTNEVALSWSALAGAESYTVLRSLTATGPYTSVASGIIGTMFVDTTVTPGATNYYRVSASLGAAGPSGQSDTASAVTAPSTPALTASVFSTTGLSLGWTTPDTVLGGFIIERSPDGVSFSPLATVAGNVRTYVDTSLPLNTTYYYRVQATNVTGFSSFSAVASATTPASGYNINIANGTAPVPPGYVQDIGELFGDRTNGLFYGWMNAAGTNITVDARYRTSTNSPDVRYATFNHTMKSAGGAYWEIEIPNGFYQVHVVGGDPDNSDSTFQYNIEGFVTGTYVPTSTATRWADFTVEVGVSDGRLTIANGPAAANNKLNFVDIYPAVPTAPAIVTQPQSQTAVQNRSVSLAATVSGSAVLQYQWYVGDAMVPDATNAVLTFPRAQPGDSGNYFVVVTNYGGAVTSSVVNLTVTPDNAAPQVVSVGSLDGKTIGIQFDEVLDAQAPVNTETISYLVNDGAVNVSSVTVRPDGKGVSLVVDAPITGTFKVDVYGIVDLAGNAIAFAVGQGTVMGFTAQDVGAPAFAGSHFTADGERVEIIGGGVDIWGASDQGYIATKTITGDFDARVKVDALAGSNTITKAVIVARETTSADSRALHVSLNPPPPGRDLAQMGYRAVAAGSTTAVGTNVAPAGVPNAWMRITRVGDVFTGYHSANGIDWTIIGQTNVTFPADMQVGFGITAHDNTLLATGVVSHISIDQTFPDIAVGVTSSPNSVSVGGTVVYNVAVTNIGVGLARSVVLTDVLPAGLSFVSALPDEGSCTVNGGTVRCELGDLIAGSYLNVAIQVTATAAGSIANTVTASSASLDMTSGNNSATVTITVEDGPPQEPIVNVGFAENGSFGGAIQTQNGVTYVVQYKDDLGAATWSVLTTIVGDGTVKPWSDPAPNGTMRYYRIVVQ